MIRWVLKLLKAATVVVLLLIAGILAIGFTKQHFDKIRAKEVAAGRLSADDKSGGVQPNAPRTEAEIWKDTAPFNKMLIVREDARLTVTKWEKGGFGSIAFVWATIENKSVHPFKDIEIKCDFTAKSGTALGTSKRTIYEIFPPKSSKSVKRFDMGLIHSQVESGRCRLGDLVVLD